MLAPLGFVVYTAALGAGDATLAGGLGSPLFAEALIRTLLMAVVVTLVCLVLGVAYSITLVMARGIWKVLLAASRWRPHS